MSGDASEMDVYEHDADYEAVMGQIDCEASIVEKLYGDVHEVEKSDPYKDFPLMLEDDGLPLCRITGWYDRGDDSVGIPSSGGWCLSPDQSGTTLEAMSKKIQRLEAEIARLAASTKDVTEEK